MAVVAVVAAAVAAHVEIVVDGLQRNYSPG